MSSQEVLDALSAIGGSPVNRPALNAFVANAQTMSALRSAETDQALQRAQASVEQQDAKEQLGNYFANLSAPNGNPVYTPSQAALLGIEGLGGMGNAQQLAQSGLLEQQQGFRGTIGDPNADPNARLAAIDAVSGKVQSPYANVGNQLVSELLPNAATTPTVTQTPMSEATEANLNSKAALNRATAANPTAFGHGFPVLTPQQSAALTTLVQHGLDPERLYAFARDPSLLDAVGKADTGVPGGIIGLGHTKQAEATSLGSGADAQTVERLSTAAQHLALVPQAINAVSRGDYPLLNKLFQGFQVQTGAAPPVVAKQLAEFLSNEMQAVIAGTTKGDAEERSTLASYFSPVSSMGQLLVATRQAGQLLGGRAKGTEQHYVGIMSQGEATPNTAAYQNRFRSMLTPEARTIFGMPLTGAQGAPAIPPAAIAQLKDGIQTHFANGQVWTLQNGKPVQVQ